MPRVRFGTTIAIFFFSPISVASVNALDISFPNNTSTRTSDLEFSAFVNAFLKSSSVAPGKGVRTFLCLFLDNVRLNVLRDSSVVQPHV